MLDNKLKALNKPLRVLINTLSFFGISSIAAGVVSLHVGGEEESNFLARTLPGNCATLIVMLIEALNVKYGDHFGKIAKLHRIACKFRNLLDLIFPYWALSKYLPIADEKLAAIIAAVVTAPLGIRCIFTDGGYGAINPKIQLVVKVAGSRDVELGNFLHRNRVSYHADRKSLRALPNDRAELEKLFDREINNGNPHLNKYAWMDIFLKAFSWSGIMTYGLYIGTGLANTELSPSLTGGVSMTAFVGGAYLGYRDWKKEDKLLTVCTSDFYHTPELQNKIHDLVGSLCSQLILITKCFDNPIDALKILLSAFIGWMFLYVSFLPGKADEESEVPESYTWSGLAGSALLALSFFYDVYTQERKALHESGADEVLKFLKDRR